MKLVTDEPFGLRDRNFVGMGIVTDTGVDYLCFMDVRNGKLYIERIEWGPGKNIHTATLKQIEDDTEWKEVLRFVTSNTTIFSPTKIKLIRNVPVTYKYSDRFVITEEFCRRKEKGLL